MPQTKEEAVAMAVKWGPGGEWSHWNEVMQSCGDAERRELATPLTTLADAAEVMRLSALAQLLPTGGIAPG